MKVLGRMLRDPFCEALAFRIRDRYPAGTPLVVICRDLEQAGFRMSNDLRTAGYAVRRRPATTNPPPRAA